MSLSIPMTRRQFLETAGLGVVALANCPESLHRLTPPQGVPSRRLSFIASGARHVPRILLLGLGRSGGSTATYLSAEPLPGLLTVVVDTDARNLAQVDAERTLLIGTRAGSGCGCFGRTDRARRAFETSRTELKSLIYDTNPDLVFVVGGLGGGTFTGAGPLVARLVREAGTLTVAVVTRPFLAGGFGRNRRAVAGLAEVAASVDTAIVVSHDRIVEITGTKATLLVARRRAAEVATGVVRAITQILTIPGLVNVGFADVRALAVFLHPPPRTTTFPRSPRAARPRVRRCGCRQCVAR